MRIHDITLPLSAELPVYPGDPAIELTSWSSIASGESCNITRLSLGTHSGTHIDAPRHFIDKGTAVDDLPLNLLVGKALVLELPGVRLIGRKELERLRIKGVERVILKTDNSELWNKPGFSKEYCALSIDGARYLVDCGVRLVGIDYLSIESFGGEGDVHRLLLENGVVILEGVHLADVTSGEYELICLPLKVKGGDGAPVRAILRGGTEHHEPEFDPHSTKWPLS